MVSEALVGFGVHGCLGRNESRARIQGTSYPAYDLGAWKDSFERGLTALRVKIREMPNEKILGFPTAVRRADAFLAQKRGWLLLHSCKRFRTLFYGFIYRSFAAANAIRRSLWLLMPNYHVLIMFECLDAWRNLKLSGAGTSPQIHFEKSRLDVA